MEKRMEGEGFGNCGEGNYNSLCVLSINIIELCSIVWKVMIPFLLGNTTEPSWSECLPYSIYSVEGKHFYTAKIHSLVVLWYRSMFLIPRPHNMKILPLSDCNDSQGEYTLHPLQISTSQDVNLLYSLYYKRK